MKHVLLYFPKGSHRTDSLALVGLLYLHSSQLRGYYTCQGVTKNRIVCTQCANKRKARWFIDLFHRRQFIINESTSLIINIYDLRALVSHDAKLLHTLTVVNPNP